MIQSNFTIDFGMKSRKDYPLAPSTGHTEEEKEFCQHLSELVVPKDNWLQEKGYIKINFDVKRRWRSFEIRGIYLVKENGKIIFHPLSYKMPISGNILGTSLRKVGAFFMPNKAFLDPVSVTYRYVISLLSLGAIISGLSLFFLDIIPSPIDKALFWTCFAGASGFVIDDWKRKYSVRSE
ncbi:hypothetical protein SAMN04487897_102617 [Paenibacillus sp. yr247]|uniref:hypothetical protein n=1 Tax=Paenibacillus sp. yr247 TaxID=1761880 RepID=UPI00088FEB23|nr:hypothetical protein [Paenibacillus sp. yr247]SDN35554.1 hypothetical protein SAMN04487897_102617 [Paenibacillus sp. yr247]